MPEENNSIGDIIGALNNVTEESGDKTVDKNIIKSDASSFGRNSKRKDPYSGQERTFYTKVATIFSETFLKVKKAGEKDTSLKTDIQGETPAEKATGLVKTGKKKSKGLIAIITGIVGAIIGLAYWLSEYLSPVQEWMSKMLFKLKPIMRVFMRIGKWIFGLFGKLTKTKAFKFLSGGKFLKFLKGSKIFKPLLKALKFVPVIGSLLNFGYGIIKFKEGDWIGGILEFAAGILGLTPAAPIGMLIDGIILIRDMMGKNEEGKFKFDEKIKGAGSWLADIGKKIGKFISDNLANLPVFGGLVLGAEAIKYFMAGDLGKGFEYLGRSILGWIVGKKGSELVINGVGFIIDLIRGVKKPADIKFPNFDTIKTFLKDIGKKIGDFFTNIKDSIWEFFDGWFDNFSFEGILESTKDAFSTVGEAIAGVFENIWNAIKNVGAWLKEKVPLPSFDDIKAIMGNIMKWTIGLPLTLGTFLKDMAVKAIDKARDIPIIGKLIPGKKVVEAKKAIQEHDGPDPSLTSQIIQFEALTAVGLKRLIKLDHAQLVTMSNIRELLDQMLKTIKTQGFGGGQGPPVTLSPSGSISNSINNESMITDVRTDYGLSPYSINV